MKQQICLKCQKEVDKVYPTIYGNAQGFCYSCSKDKCHSCGIVLGIFPCSSFNCGEYHGMRSEEDSKICSECVKERTTEKKFTITTNDLYRLTNYLNDKGD